jgi:hypothetical protein
LNFYLDVENLNKLEDEAQIKEMVRIIKTISYNTNTIIDRFNMAVVFCPRNFAQVGSRDHQVVKEEICTKSGTYHSMYYYSSLVLML